MCGQICSMKACKNAQLLLISQMLVVTYLQLRRAAVPSLELKINGETQNCSCLLHDLHGLRKGGGGSEGHHQLGESALTCFKGGPHVDAKESKQ